MTECKHETISLHGKCGRCGKQTASSAIGHEPNGLCCATKLTDQQVLEECIQQALARCYFGFMPNGMDWERWKGLIGSKKLEYVEGLVKHRQYPTLIFDHDFAKALFKTLPMYRIKAERQREDGTEIDDVGYAKQESWQFHLQQLVLSTDRIDYLRNYLKNEKEV